MVNVPPQKLLVPTQIIIDIKTKSGSSWELSVNSDESYIGLLEDDSDGYSHVIQVSNH